MKKWVFKSFLFGSESAIIERIPLSVCRPIKFELLVDDLIQSIAEAFQFIFYYHPVDYIQALGKAR